MARKKGGPVFKLQRIDRPARKIKLSLADWAIILSILQGKVSEYERVLETVKDPAIIITYQEGLAQYKDLLARLRAL